MTAAERRRDRMVQLIAEWGDIKQQIAECRGDMPALYDLLQRRDDVDAELAALQEVENDG